LFLRKIYQQFHYDIPSIIFDLLSLLIVLTRSLEGFPTLENEVEGDSLNSVYMHGKLNFGNFSRTVFFRPLSCTKNGQSTVLQKITESRSQNNSELLVDVKTGIQCSNPSKWISPISNKISFLISQSDTPTFKEKLKNQFHTVQIFRDNVHSRAFNLRNIENYRNLQFLEKERENYIGVVTKIGDEFEVLKSDLFLLQCLGDALDDSSRTMVREGILDLN
jgi:hypothetical protein